MALCDRTDVENRLGGQDLSADDSIITALISAVQDHMERVAGHDLEAGAHTEVFDPPAGDVWLTHTPVNSITSTTVDGTALSTTSDLTLDGDIGRLARTTNSHRRGWGTSKLQSISVTYNGGYTTPPEDLVDICARAVARIYQAGESADAAGNQAIKQISLAGSDSVTFTDAASNVSSIPLLTPDEASAVKAYFMHTLA